MGEDIKDMCLNKFDRLEEKIEEKDKGVNEKIRVLFKKIDSVQTFFENTNKILVKLELLTEQQEIRLKEREVYDIQRDKILLDASKTLESLKKDHDATRQGLDKLNDDFRKEQAEGSIKLSSIGKNVLFICIGVIVTAVMALIFK